MLNSLRRKPGFYSEFQSPCCSHVTSLSSFQEKLCYIALDFDSEMKAASESSDKEKGKFGRL